MDKRLELNKTVKNNISEALMRLMQRKHFSDISVSNIIREAKVARVSYYRNFDSKESILKYYTLELIQSFKESDYMPRPERGDIENLANIFRFVALHGADLKILFDAGLSGLFLDVLNEFFLDTNENENPMELWVLYARTGAIFNIMHQWVQEGLQHSPEEIAYSFLEFAKFVKLL